MGGEDLQRQSVDSEPSRSLTDELLRVSVRLSVVLSQSAGKLPRHRDLESEIVAGLIAAAGIDLSLIGSIDALDAAATDRMMLDGLRGDLALLCWFSPEEAAAHLTAAGIEGRRAPHRFDPEPAYVPHPDPSSPAPFRRIYYFDLTQHASAPSLQSALEQLLASRRVVTFGLGNPRTPKPDRTGNQVPPSGKRPTVLPLARPPATRPPATRATEVASPDGTAAERNVESDRWDALVDELNDSNI